MVVGGIALGLSAFSIVSLIASSVLLIIAFRSCTAENTGRTAYTSSYIEKWLEQSYDTNFSFLRKEEHPTLPGENNCVYYYTDDNGLEVTVVQSYHTRYFKHYYVVAENYSAVKMFSDENVLKALNESGYKYRFDQTISNTSATSRCYMTTPTYKDIRNVCEVLYSTSDNYFLKSPNKVSNVGNERDDFIHTAPCFIVTTENDINLSYLNTPFTEEGHFPYQHISLQSYIETTERYYKMDEERNQKGNFLPDSEYDDPEPQQYEIFFNDKQLDYYFYKESEEYAVYQDNCFKLVNGEMQYCPLMEKLAEISGLIVVKQGDNELCFYRENDPDGEMIMRLYYESASENTFMFLNKEHDTYTFSNGDIIIKGNTLKLSTEDINNIFGITVEFDTKKAVAKLIPSDIKEDEE